MQPYLTTSNRDLDRLIRQTPEGMMFWAGTCADPTATCAGCRHYGFDAVTRNDAGNAMTTCRYSTRCSLYRKHTGQPGASLDPKTPACKYFEAKPA